MCAILDARRVYFRVLLLNKSLYDLSSQTEDKNRKIINESIKRKGRNPCNEDGEAQGIQPLKTISQILQ